MAHSVRQKVVRWSALLWLAISTIYLLVVSVLICGDARFPLTLGAIRTTGRAGLWFTLAPAVAGLLAFFLVAFRIRSGAIVLGAYCWFWIALLACVLPGVWNARQSFCMHNMCIRTPWIGRLLVLGLAAPCVMAAIWAKHEFARMGQRALPG